MQKGTRASGSYSYRKGKKKYTLVFKEELIPLYYTHSIGVYSRSPAAGTPQHNNVAEEGTRFWPMRLVHRSSWLR